MALFRDLTRTIAEAEGVSEMMVTGVGQYLRDAGLISKNGRGRAAARMSATDAVNLIIGVNACGLAKEAAHIVSLYRSLTIHIAPLYRSNYLIPIRIFDETRELGEALELILKYLGSTSSQYHMKEFLELHSAYLEIGFGRPVPSAYIKISREAPPSLSNPFNSIETENIIAFAHYWDIELWSMHEGQREIKIIGTSVLTAVSELLYP